MDKNDKLRGHYIGLGPIYCSRVLGGHAVVSSSICTATNPRSLICSVARCISALRCFLSEFT